MSYLPRKLNIARWLLPLFVMLVVLEIASFPYVLSTIYSEKFVSPDRRLAYVGGRIESGDGFIYNGAGKVRLNLFDTTYDGVQSDDKYESVIAPGTKGKDTVQLLNKVSGEITYTAVFYIIKDDERIPIVPTVVGQFTDAETYPMPEGCTEENVFRAITGKLAGGEVLSFDIEWVWDFERNPEETEPSDSENSTEGTGDENSGESVNGSSDTENTEGENTETSSPESSDPSNPADTPATPDTGLINPDELDTELGDKDELDDVKIAVDITVVDENEYTIPLYQDTQAAMFIALIAVTVLILIILFVIVLA